METLVKIIEEKMLLIEQLENQLLQSKKELETEEESKLFWYKKFIELELTLKPKDIEQLENQLLQSKKELETEKESKIFWYNKFIELELTLKPKDNE